MRAGFLLLGAGNREGQGWRVVKSHSVHTSISVIQQDTQYLMINFIRDIQ